MLRHCNITVLESAHTATLLSYYTTARLHYHNAACWATMQVHRYSIARDNTAQNTNHADATQLQSCTFVLLHSALLMRSCTQGLLSCSWCWNGYCNTLTLRVLHGCNCAIAELQDYTATLCAVGTLYHCTLQYCVMPALEYYAAPNRHYSSTLHH